MHRVGNPQQILQLKPYQTENSVIQDKPEKKICSSRQAWQKNLSLKQAWDWDQKKSVVQDKPEKKICSSRQAWDTHTHTQSVVQDKPETENTVVQDKPEPDHFIYIYIYLNLYYI